MARRGLTGAAVRVITRDGDPWFVAADVCGALNFSGDPGQHTRRLDDDEKGLISIQTLGGGQQVAAINESGLYSLILGSRKPEAKRFKKWVTAEVLPAWIRTRRALPPPIPPAERRMSSQSTRPACTH